MLSKASVAVTVKEWVPVANGGVVKAHSPNPVVVVRPMTAPPRDTVIVLPGSAVPDKVGVASLVRPPLPMKPAASGVLLFAALRTGCAGASVSTAMVVTADAALGLPAASVKVPAGMLTVPLVMESAKGVKTMV